MKGRYWTEEEDEFLLGNVGKMSLVDISEELGRTYSSVKNRISSIRPGTEFFKKDHFKAEIKSRVLGNDEQIPGIPGMLDLLRCMSGCMDRASPQAAPKKRRPDTDARQSLIKRMLDSGMTGHEIVHEIGIPKSTVYRHIKEMRA